MTFAAWEAISIEELSQRTKRQHAYTTCLIQQVMIMTRLKHTLHISCNHSNRMNCIRLCLMQSEDVIFGSGDRCAADNPTVLYDWLIISLPKLLKVETDLKGPFQG